MTPAADTVLMRLRRGPADERSLARWCDLQRTALIRPLLARLCREREIHDIGGRYSRGIPAARITIGRGYRWRFA